MHTEEVMPLEDNPFFIPPLPLNPTGPQIHAAVWKHSDAAALQATLHTMEVDSDPPLHPIPGTAMLPPL